MILLGVVCVVVSIELFLIFNDFIDGGIIGVLLILDYFFKLILILNFVLFVVVLNIFFMIFGYKYIGKIFFVFMMIGIVGFVVIEFLFYYVEVIIIQFILVIVFGGFLFGFGVGFVI